MIKSGHVNWLEILSEMEGASKYYPSELLGACCCMLSVEG